VCFGGEGEVETSRAGKSTSCRLLHFVNRSLLASADAGSIHTTSNEEASGSLNGRPRLFAFALEKMAPITIAGLIAACPASLDR
jgi:hypothetical protein